ncbi:MAG: enoyl-CoA hydratase [Bradyrhizobiaceae bacterium]|nr:enoyl-CoA hydratase [Bradyrhizobiaceae bacterium]
MTTPMPAAAVSQAEPILLREDLSGIAILTLNRPKARNTLSDAMLAALSEAFGLIARDRSIRAVVLAAKGPAFCAGHDLKEMTAHRSDSDRGRAYFVDLFTRCATLMQAIVHLPQPVIAAVHATATAAGCQLVATCDLAVAARTASFGTTGINVGLFCSTPMVALSRNVGRKQALEILLTGDMISADDAFRMGLVNRLSEPGAEYDAAVEMARKIAAKSAPVIKVGKEAFYRQLEMGLAEAYRYAGEVMVENMLARDAEEGIAAFVEKRPPRWEDQ